MTSEQRLAKRVQTVADNADEVRRLCAEVLRRRTKIPRPSAPGKTKEERNLTKAEANRGKYERVRERDGGLCQVQLVQVMGRCDGALHIDHQWGRGKEPTKVTNCRSLCARHDRMKTENETEKGHSRLLWLCDYREWAVALGYEDEVVKTDGQIALERAQHPEER